MGGSHLYVRFYYHFRYIMLQLELKIKEMEELNKEGRMKQSKMEQYIEENYENNKKIQQMLLSKESEIEKLKSELQRIDIFKAQVGIRLCYNYCNENCLKID